MEVGKAKYERFVLERNILKLIKEYEDASGLHVSNISISTGATKDKAKAVFNVKIDLEI